MMECLDTDAVSDEKKTEMFKRYHSNRGIRQKEAPKSHRSSSMALYNAMLGLVEFNETEAT